MTPVLETRSLRPPHLSDDTLTRLMDQELSPARKLLAKGHLQRCRGCQTRFEALARTARAVIEYRQNVVSLIGPLPSVRRDEFLRQVDRLLESAPARPWWKRLLNRLEAPSLGNFLPSCTSALAMLCAVFLLLLFWRSQVRSLSAAEFLNRAVSSEERPGKIRASELIRHRFRVTTAKKTIEHDVYLDVSGRRRPQSTELDSDDVGLPVRLALAGVNWDDPLSAISFKTWHDRQPNPKDDVHPSGEGLLTVSTRLGSSEIAEESLTVREGDFHPVKRTIDFRDSGAVEISEVSVDLVVGTNAVRSYIEPKPVHRVPVLLAPSKPPLPTAAQMDETELEARLILNQHHADMGEQIEVKRNVQGVQILGLVESEERQKELKDSLQSVPLLSVVIQSYDDLRSAGNPAVRAEATEQLFAVAEVSPLERYFMQHGRSRRDLSRISAGLFNRSLAIGQSTRSIEQIALRFPSDENLSPAAILARNELLSRIVARLLDDLNKQQQLLSEANIPFDLGAPSPGNPDTFGIDLVRLADRNAAATKELISGASEPYTPEKVIVTELAETISQLRATGLTFSPRP